MSTAFPRVYRSFADFERHELRRLDHMYGSADEMIEDLLMSELEEESAQGDDDGILFDSVED